MEYNKRQFSKTNNKKVLHKVKKNWVVVSMALLSAIGGGAAITHANAAHADTNAGNQSATSQIQSSAVSGTQLKVSSGATQLSSTAQNSTDPKVITQQANHMYRRVLGNATQQAMAQPSSASQKEQSSAVNRNSSSKASVSLTDQGLANLGQHSTRNNSKSMVPWSQFVQHHNYLVKHNLGAHSHLKLGDASTGRITEIWQYKNQGNHYKEIKQETQSDMTGTPFNMNQYLRTVPNGYENPEVARGQKIPKVYQGYQTVFINVQPIPQSDGAYIKINYLDMNNHNEEEKHVVSSDSDGAPFGYNKLFSYLITPPNGYTTVNYTKSDTDSVHAMHPKNGKYLGDVNPATVPTSFEPGLTNINIEIVKIGSKDAGGSDTSTVGKPIYVNYINQHNVNVNTQSDDLPITGNSGNTFNVTNARPIPSGYHLAHQYEDVNYKLGSDTQYANIAVAGNQLTSPDTFTIHRVTNDGSAWSDVKVPVNGSVGDTFNVDPSAYAPSGYYVDNNDKGYTGTILANGLSQNSVQYVYDKKSNQNKQSQPIHVTYINQHGQDVNTASDDKAINGTIGNSVNLTNDAPIPTGYTLDSNQNTNRTVSGNPQNVSLFVTGNKASDTFTIHRNENVVKSDGTSTGKTNKLSDVSDTIQGNVGDSETVQPSDYVPSGDQVNASDNPVQVMIMPNGKLAPVNSTQFTYNKSANGKPLPSNIVTGSIVLEDKDDNNQTVGSPIQISGVKGSKVDYNDYMNSIDQSVQSDYYPIKPLNTNSTLSSNGNYPYLVGEYGYVKVEFVDESQNDMDMSSDGMQEPVGSSVNVKNIVDNYLNGHSQYKIASDSSYNPSKQPTVKVTASNSSNPQEIEVSLVNKPKPQQPEPITVKYVNQHGVNVTPSGYQPVSGNLGAMVDVTKDDPIPTGYSLADPSEKVTYVVGGKAYDVTIRVQGNHLKAPKTFTIHQMSSDNKPLGDKTVAINGSVGDPYRVDLAQYLPNGYYTNNKNAEVSGVILPNGNLSNASTTFAYNKVPATAEAQPIYVSYINQNGQNVNMSADNNAIKGKLRSLVNLENIAPVPSGYTINSDDIVQRVITNYPQHIQLKVTGNKLSSNFMIHRSETKVNSDGQPVSKAQQLSDAVVPIQGQVGNKNTATINPTKYVPQGDKLTAADQPITVTLGNDGKLTPSSSTQFSYDKPVVTSLTANIQYEDEFSHKIVGTLTDKGDKNSPINYNAYEHQLPNNYVFIGLGNHNQNIENNGENDVILVARPANGRIVYKDVNNSDAPVGYAPIKGYVGQSINYDQYRSQVPAHYDYIAPTDVGSTLKDGHDYTILVNEAGKSNSGSLINVSANVVYEDVDNHDNVVKTTPISGLAGSHIDYFGYQHQIPSGYSYAGMGNYNDNLEKNGRNVILVAENGNQHIPSALPNVTANILYEDVDNHNSVVSVQRVNGLKGGQINYRNYTEHVPSGYTLAGMGDYDDNLENGENNVIYVTENGNQHIPSTLPTVSANILYEDVDNNKKAINIQHVSGIKGSHINYRNYTEHVPSGYTLAGMGNYDDNLENGENNVIYVTENGKRNQPSAPAKVSANLVYENINDGDQPVGSTVNLSGVAGTPINYDTYKSGQYMPAGYHFVGMGRNDSNLENGDIDYMKVAANGSYNSGNNVAPTGPANNNTTPATSYATNDLVYVDNANHVIANQAVTGEVGTPVNYSSYVPAGYVMTGDVTGSRTYQNNGRDYIYVEPLNNSSAASNSAASSTSAGQSSVASVSTAPVSSAPASNNSHTASDETSDNHDDSDDNESQSTGHHAAKAPNDYGNNSSALGVNHSGHRYGDSANTLGINSYPKDTTAGDNETNVGGVNGEANESGSNNGKLPQTGEVNSSKKAIAAALLAISATLGALDAVVRRRRDND